MLLKEDLSRTNIDKRNEQFHRPWTLCCALGFCFGLLASFDYAGMLRDDVEETLRWFGRTWKALEKRGIGKALESIGEPEDCTRIQRGGIGRNASINKKTYSLWLKQDNMDMLWRKSYENQWNQIKSNENIKEIIEIQRKTHENQRKSSRINEHLFKS